LADRLPSPGLHPVVGLAIGVLAASTASILIRRAQEHAPSFVIASYRLALASLALAPLTATRYRDELRGFSRRQLWMSLAAGLLLSGHFATWITSLEYTTVASSAVLVATAPLFVALLTPIVLHESLGRNLLMGMGLSFFGSIVVGIGDACIWRLGLVCPATEDLLGGRAIQGDLLALAGALAGAGYMLIGRRARGSAPLVPYITLVYGTAALAMILISGVAGHRLLGYPTITYLWLGLLALLPQLVAHTMTNWVLRYLSAAYVSIILLGEPLGSSLLAYFLLREVPGAISLVGGAMILVGIAMASLRTARTSLQAHSTPA